MKNSWCAEPCEEVGRGPVPAPPGRSRGQNLFHRVQECRDPVPPSSRCSLLCVLQNLLSPLLSPPKEGVGQGGLAGPLDPLIPLPFGTPWEKPLT